MFDRHSARGQTVHTIPSPNEAVSIDALTSELDKFGRRRLASWRFGDDELPLLHACLLRARLAGVQPSDDLNEAIEHCANRISGHRRLATLTLLGFSESSRASAGDDLLRTKSNRDEVAAREFGLSRKWFNSSQAKYGGISPREYCLRLVAMELAIWSETEFEMLDVDLDQDLDMARAPISNLNTPSEIDLVEVKRIVNGHFSTELELSRLAENLLDAHPVIEHLNVHAALVETGAESYDYVFEREFQARFDQYIVGFSVGDEVKSVLMRRLPELKDVIWLPQDTSSVDSLIERFMEDGFLQQVNRQTEDGFEPVIFEPVESDDPAVISLDALGVARDRYRLMRARLGENPELRSYRSRICVPLPKSRRRCGWSADGLTYLDNLTIDISQMPDARESAQTNAYFFLPPGTVSATPSGNPLGFRRRINDWILRNHGFCVQW